jgi:hypothetical protein
MRNGRFIEAKRQVYLDLRAFRLVPGEGPRVEAT